MWKDRMCVCVSIRNDWSMSARLMSCVVVIFRQWEAIKTLRLDDNVWLGSFAVDKTLNLGCLVSLLFLYFFSSFFFFSFFLFLSFKELECEFFLDVVVWWNGYSWIMCDDLLGKCRNFETKVRRGCRPPIVSYFPIYFF